LEVVPRIPKPPHKTKQSIEAYTVDEIGLWLAACRHAKAAKNLCGCDPPLWHKSLVRFLYNTGLRIDTALMVEWSMVDHDRKHWITIPPELMKGGRQGGIFYLNRAARHAAETMRIAGQPRLFLWSGWPQSQNWLHATRRKILAASEIPPDRRFGYHGLRRCLINYAATKNGLLAEMIAGHRGGSVTREYYVQPDAVVELLESIPQPEEPRAARTVQGRLFD
jgi:integrase